MARRIALLFLALASPASLLLFLLPGSAAGSIFAVLVMGFPVALIVVATARDSGLGPLGPPLVGLLLVLEACTAAMLLLRGHVGDGPWVAGLPLAAAIQLYGLWLVPLVLVALTYALTFDRFALRDVDLDRLDAHRRRSGGEG